MKCPRCGGEVPPGARACPYCTTLVSDFKNIVPYGMQPQKPEKKRGCLGCLIPFLAVCGVLFIALIIFAIFSGDDSSASSSSSKTSAPYNPRTSSSSQGSSSGAYSSNPKRWDSSNSNSNSNSNTTTNTGNGNLGDYDVEIKGAVTTTDYEGNPAIVVTYSWTNNSDETTSCMTSVIASAFQDGVELETAIIMDDSVFDASPYMKDVRPGTTIDIQQAFELTSSSNVEIEISELFSFDDNVVSETFSIQ